GYGQDALRLILQFAFGKMGLHRVELHVFDFNERAIACYERVGFVREGVRREALFRDNRYHDIIVMGITRNEFQAREAERQAAASE
ncbi:MAG TPA: GNAT family protein, partial [Symbiobacteriaceae bacterium]|nr:GNAT family protein [Symbiobacteriaceae bacterium]